MAAVHLWVLVTNLGDSAVLLPLALVIVLWSGKTSWMAAAIWGLLFGVDVLGVGATKLLYMGWGLHPPGVDFTGLSGHSALSMLVWPTIGSLLAAGRTLRWRVVLPLLGALLSLAIVVSRLTTDAHTPIEATLGALWGGILALVFLLRLPPKPSRVSDRADRLMPVALVLAVALTYGHIFPSTQLLGEIACQLSGHPHPYTRADLQGQSADQGS